MVLSNHECPTDNTDIQLLSLVSGTSHKALVTSFEPYLSVAYQFK